MPSYKTPNRINAVSIVMLLVLAAAVYLGYVFFPVYWDSWTVDHELREAVAETYQLMLRPEPDRTDDMRKLLQATRDKCIKLAHITDPDFDVTMDLEGDHVALHAKYEVTVRHPIGNYTTTVHFDRTATADNKRVKWE